ncbi:MAG: hypothetical protein ACRD96_15885, partial [Bryobacteraceae bacterium]
MSATAWAAGEALGVAVASGSFRVDRSLVYGNTTVFRGTQIETEQASSRLQLADGTRMELGRDSRARVYDKRVTLERGMGEMETPSGYQIEARSLRIATAAAKSVARVKLQGERQVLVAALAGPVRVFNEIGLLVANLEPGASLLLTPQAAQPGAFQMTGCLVQTRDGRFLIVEANQTIELRGSGLAAEVNNRVEIRGNAFRSAAAAPPASQVVQVDSLKQVAAGGCQDVAARLESAGVRMARAGQAPATPRPEVAVGGGGHTGAIIA